MVNSVEGVYRNGKVELAEPLPEAEESRVIVTFLQSASFGASIVQAAASQHLALAGSGDGKSAPVEILDPPFSFQGGVQQGRTGRAADMRPPLTPVHTGV